MTVKGMDSVIMDASWIVISLDRCHCSNWQAREETGYGTFTETLEVAANSWRKSGNNAHLSPYRIMPGLGSLEEHTQGGGKNKPPCRWPKQCDMGGKLFTGLTSRKPGTAKWLERPQRRLCLLKDHEKKRGKRTIQGAAGPPRLASALRMSAHRCNSLSAMRGVLKSLYYTSNVTIQRKSTLLLSTFVCVCEGVKTFKGTVVLYLQP